ncbi:MAG: ATP-NAD kinase family protein [Candidatus Bathyarchaeota archaeon]|nr:MAG: ATP-NAD kinase family protein [Candidatus Bathyarchaeota archaeon]
MKVGFLVNPIAGMGGKVGLKGTDGVVERALELGATSIAPQRGIEFLKHLTRLGVNEKIEVVSCPAEMGFSELTTVGFDASILPMDVPKDSTAKDTKTAVELMVRRGVDLIVFVGGDGTARDIMDAVLEVSTYEDAPLVLGVPAGVKMYSGIFATNPTDAAHVVEAVVNGEAQTTDFEIIDADEETTREDHFTIRLCGLLKGPLMPTFIQGSKQVSSEATDEHENQMATARFAMEELDRDAVLLLCPGTTVRCVADLLGVAKTLLGVDVYWKGTLRKDVNETAIREAIAGKKRVQIIVSPIGRQGILFGRGNQQVSPNIIRSVGKENIFVVATKAKIRGIEGGKLRVDTGDEDLDKQLGGFIRVMTDYREWRLMPIE